MATKSRSPVGSFFSTIIANGTPPVPPLIDEGFARNMFQDAFEALERLEDYEQFLRQARQEKLRTRTTSTSFEHLVLARADRAARDCEIAVERSLELFQYFHVSGYYSDALNTICGVLEDSGPQQVSEIFGYMKQSTDRLMKQVPLRAATKKRVFDFVADAIAREPSTITVEAGCLHVITSSGPARLIRSRSIMIRSRRVVPKQTIVNVLSARRFDPFVTTLGGRSVVQTDLIDLRDAGVDPYIWAIEDLLLAVPLKARSEMNRHVSRIRQIGIPAYQGNEEVLVVTAIVLAVWLTDKFIGWVCDQAGGGNECEVNVWKILLILLFFLPGDDSNNQSTSTVITFSNPDPA
jgi:hypothetical protein